jgi:hypothetical protein
MDSGAAYENPSTEGLVRIAGEGTVNKAQGIAPILEPYPIEIVLLWKD